MRRVSTTLAVDSSHAASSGRLQPPDGEPRLRNDAVEARSPGRPRSGRYRGRHVGGVLRVVLLLAAGIAVGDRAPAQDRPAAALTGCTISDNLESDGDAHEDGRRRAMGDFAAAVDAAFKDAIVRSALFTVRSRGTDFDKAGDEDDLVGNPTYDPGEAEVQFDCELVGFEDVTDQERYDGGLTGIRWESRREIAAEIVVTVQRGRPRELVCRSWFEVRDRDEWLGAFRQGTPTRPPAGVHDRLVRRLGTALGVKAAKGALREWTAWRARVEAPGSSGVQPSRDGAGRTDAGRRPPARIAVIPSPWNDKAAQDFANAVQRSIVAEDAGGVVQVIDPDFVLFSLSNLGAPPPQKGFAASKQLVLQNARTLAGRLDCVAFVVVEIGTPETATRMDRDRKVWTAGTSASIEVVEASNGTSVGAHQEPYRRQQRDELGLIDALTRDVAEDLGSRVVGMVRTGVEDGRIRVPLKVQKVDVTLNPYMVVPTFRKSRNGDILRDGEERRSVEATVFIDGERQAMSTPGTYRIELGRRRITIDINGEYLVDDFVTIELDPDEDGYTAIDPEREFLLPAPEGLSRLLRSAGDEPIDEERIREAKREIEDLPFVSPDRREDGTRVASPWNPLRAIGLDE